MKLPRDLSGSDLAVLLRRHGYEVTRQTGSHLRLSSSLMGHTHRVTVPLHRSLAIGTLARILADIARYLEIHRDELSEGLFGQG